MTSTQRTLELLRNFESPNITLIEPDNSWPIVWSRARGVYVWDTKGRRYLDLTAAFGVAAAGHANPAVVKAGQKQLARLTHAMGDVHPHELKAELARVLSGVTFERWFTAGRGSVRNGAPIVQRVHGRSIFCSAGFEAVEAALKTALLATNRSGVICFADAYHGLGYGALSVTQRAHFSAPFTSQLGKFAVPIVFPTARRQLDEVETSARQVFTRRAIGAVIVEPIQVRGGVKIPPRGFLRLLRKLCDEFGALLILDEIYTGFGRTGRWFACEHESVSPDVVCLGKGLTGGFPLSACVGRADVMEAAWPPATGDPIHTSTFLGHPVGCAMALANIRELTRGRLISRTSHLGKYFQRSLSRLRGSLTLKIRGRAIGLLGGVALSSRDGAPAGDAALRIVKQMLAAGFVVLPDGPHGNVISLTPPLTISRGQLTGFFRALEPLLRSL